MIVFEPSLLTIVCGSTIESQKTAQSLFVKMNIIFIFIYIPSLMFVNQTQK